MSITYRVDTQLGLIVTTVEGGVSPAEMDDYHKKLASDSSVDPTFNALADLRAVLKPSLESETLRRLAREARKSDRSSIKRKLAIVAPVEVIFGLSRMYQVEREDEHTEIQVFRQMDEALDWLGSD